MGAFLVPNGKGRRIPLDKAVIFIGRHPDCDVVLTKSRKISRKHCCVAQVNDRLVVRDLGSMNGVRVNGKPVKSEVTLRIGDRVAIGDLIYEVQVERTEKASSNGGAGKPTPAQAKAADAEPLEMWQISQEFPVPIPDEDKSFQVEVSRVDARRSVESADAVAVEESGDIYRMSQDEPAESGDSFVELKPE